MSYRYPLPELGGKMQPINRPQIPSNEWQSDDLLCCIGLAYCEDNAPVWEFDEGCPHVITIHTEYAEMHGILLGMSGGDISKLRRWSEGLGGHFRERYPCDEADLWGMRLYASHDEVAPSDEGLQGYRVIWGNQIGDRELLFEWEKIKERAAIAVTETLSMQGRPFTARLGQGVIPWLKQLSVSGFLL